MQDIPAYKFIIAATVIFIVGLFVFTIIFRAYLTFKQLEEAVIAQGTASEEQATLVILGAVPWALGGVYIALLGAVIYFLLKGNKKPKIEIPPSSFRKY